MRTVLCKQRTGVLWPAGSPSLRAVPARGHWASNDKGPQTPQSNGFIERFHPNVARRALRVRGRTTWYEIVEEVLQGLEAYPETSGRMRPHRGCAMEGRSPCQVFKAGLKDAKHAANTREETPKNTAA